ncbi:uncharacterized protein A1O9_09527 [Exophiala aquamarina CBS 119918]|uniref:Carboxylic ester hydrolase n=1 Tax=Exophiala aquamarina CBS 119918 TaxID=1182545 RepID=A0A072P3F2_9EURO|nr:uncharacterized protein A1O9_09527 [Exophiala aquamarina CBS 119918]KEF54361.1 hypothetical protein A1O9_09527 [Exophiala aquamarina CBS 119918]
MTMFVLATPLLAQDGRQQCDANIFLNVTLFGGEILNTTTQYHSNLTFGPEYFLAQINSYPVNITGLDVCEVAVTYTHPGQNDTINTMIWLPRPDRWNGRFMGIGGGGWGTGQGIATLHRPAAEGYAAVLTDGGHSMVEPDSSPRSWGLTSPGNVNWALLQDFASIALDDAATLGKGIVKAFYGRPQNYSYWNGCSTGGRQGHMMAQRYPHQYNGILASAPAFNWNEFLLAEYWPQLILNEIGEYPSPCELEAVRLAAIEACDSLDGVADGIISYPGLCDFDPSGAVGRVFNCTTTYENVTITSAAATVANATWAGPVDPSGNSLWYGLNPGATFDALVNISCTNDTCVGNPFSIPADWISIFLARDSQFDLTTINRTSFSRLFRKSANIYDSIIGTADPDLTEFRDAGGKLITWHGLADQLIFPNGTANYVQRVQALDSHATDYYRFFEAPGVFHCGAGPGWFPGDAFQSLVDWVENGVAPETLEAKAIPGLLPGLSGGATKLRTANLCLYPKTMVYVGGDPNQAGSFSCQ